MDKYFTLMDGYTEFLPQEGDERLKAGRFFITIDSPNESIYYCPEDGKIIQLGGGVGKRSIDGGEIFNDYINNIAIGRGAIASGIETQSGNKAFKILEITEIEPKNKYTIKVSGNVQPTDSDVKYQNGDLLQITANVDHNNMYKIADIQVASDNLSSIITTERNGSVNNQKLQLKTNNPTEVDNLLYVAGKNIGDITNWSMGATAHGISSKATGACSFTAGLFNIAAGDYSSVFGKENIGGYAALVGGSKNEAGDYGFTSGSGNKALGTDSVATGVGTQALRYASRAGGGNTIAKNEYATAEGLGTQTYAQAQFVVGKYNKSVNNALFVVGIGENDSNRKNALEVRENGDIYVSNGETRLVKLTEFNALANILPGQKTSEGGAILSIYGTYTKASQYALASGYSKATAQYSTAFGWGTASALYSFATGYDANASGHTAAAFGYKTNATGQCQFVVGRHNLTSSALFIVGNGVISNETKSNTFEVYGNGSAWLQHQGQDPNSVVIKSYVDNKFNSIKNEMILTDKTTGADYKVYINNGKLQIEEVAE